MTIKPLSDITLDELYAVFSNAFSDYERSFSEDEFSKMLKRRGYKAELSFGAFEGEMPVSFILNGFGLFNGEPTIYDTGTGTIMEYRGKGLIGQIFKESIPVLQRAGATQYLLEVLKNNSKALSVYKKLGFVITRELNYYLQDMDRLKIDPAFVPPAGIEFKDIDLERKHEMQKMFDFQPSWQNNFEAMLKSSGDLKVVGAFKRNTFVGYGIIEPASGDIPQLAVISSERRTGIGSAILKKILQLNKNDKVKIINIESSCKAVTSFIESRGIPQCGSQYEMLKKPL